jgi:hypothetical protein
LHITGDETWVYGYDVEMKMQSSQWVGKNSPRPKKGVAGQVKRESHVDGFFDIEGVVHHEFLHQGQTMNRWYYLEVLKRLRENVRRKDLACGERTPGSSITAMLQLMRRY